jgi:2-oxoisovalerate dehydrogenase E2 component (dihydrolipoyl transacylase)
MEDFLIPDRERIAAAVRALAQIDRATRPVTNGLAGPSARPFVEPVPSAPSPAPAWPELLAASVREVPQAASVVEVDCSRLLQRLDEVRDQWSQRGLEPSPTPLFAEALVAALRSLPAANAAFDAAARGIRHYAAVHLGLSLASPDGAQARHGVIRDADTRNLLGLAVEAQAIAATGSSDPAVLAEATVTLTDFGPSGALFGVPLVLPGQSVAVRVGAIEERVLAQARGFLIAPTAFVCLSIDHRSLDGMDAGAVLASIKRLIEANQSVD